MDLSKHNHYAVTKLHKGILSQNKNSTVIGQFSQTKNYKKKNPKRWKYYEEKFSALPFVYIKKFVVNTPMGNASSHFMAFPAFLRSEPVIGVNAARPTC